MKFELTLTEEDYLIQSLYAASKSELVRKRKRTTSIQLGLGFSLMALLSYLGNNLFFSWWDFLIMGLILVVGYPIYQPISDLRHHRKYIAETYKNRFGKTSQVEFSGDQLLTNDYVGDSKLDLGQLEQVCETGTHFFLKFNTAEVLILPKDSIPLEDFKVLLNQLIDKYQLPYTQELNWKFR